MFPIIITDIMRRSLEGARGRDPVRYPTARTTRRGTS
jgi:hypothetical protein